MQCGICEIAKHTVYKVPIEFFIEHVNEGVTSKVKSINLALLEDRMPAVANSVEPRHPMMLNSFSGEHMSK